MKLIPHKINYPSNSKEVRSYATPTPKSFHYYNITWPLLDQPCPSLLYISNHDSQSQFRHCAIYYHIYICPSSLIRVPICHTLNTYLHNCNNRSTSYLVLLSSHKWRYNRSTKRRESEICCVVTVSNVNMSISEEYSKRENIKIFFKGAHILLHYYLCIPKFYQLCYTLLTWLLKCYFEQMSFKILFEGWIVI